MRVRILQFKFSLQIPHLIQNISCEHSDEFNYSRSLLPLIISIITKYNGFCLANTANLSCNTFLSSVDCGTETRVVTLGWARDVIGNWLAVLQSDSHPQPLTVNTCR